MRAQTTPDVRLARLAARQHGVVSRDELLALGFDRGTIARRVESGRLHRLYRGVYAVGHTVVPRDGRYLAAVMACGDRAVLSHRSAAELWGIRPSAAAQVDVTVPHTSGVRSTTRIAVHRPRRRVESTRRHGIPVTTPGQTLADLALALPRRPLGKAVEMADVRKLDVAVPPDHPGADFCWPEERLIVETDGYEHHGTRAAFERDRARDAYLSVRGWHVVRVTEPQVHEEPAFVAAW